jgi:hypothetical protein
MHAVLVSACINYRKSPMAAFLRSCLLALLALAVLVPPAVCDEATPNPWAAAIEPLSSSRRQFEYGHPRKFVDAVGWTFGIPRKLILWDRRVMNHHVTVETEQELAEYLDSNGLVETKVRINQYDPLGEWQRLAANKDVGAGWRYTFGAFSTLKYTVLPGRLFGADRYNPYTDSIYIYSDVACLAQEQGACAKLVHARKYRGTYAAITSIPIVQLWPKKLSKKDVIDYTLANGTADQRREATRILYAEFGAEVGGQTSLLVGSNLPLTLAGAGIGHIAGYVKSSAFPGASAGSSSFLLSDLSSGEPALAPHY